MSDLQDAVAKLSLGPDDILVVDATAVEVEDVAKLIGRYRNHVLMVVPRPGMTAKQTFSVIDKESAANFLKSCTEQL